MQCVNGHQTVKFSYTEYSTTCADASTYSGEGFTARDQNDTTVGTGVLGNPSDGSDYDSYNDWVDTCEFTGTVAVPENLTIYKFKVERSSRWISYTHAEMVSDSWDIGVTLDY
jgi:hypothetical protein